MDLRSCSLWIPALFGLTGTFSHLELSAFFFRNWDVLNCSFG